MEADAPIAGWCGRHPQCYGHYRHDRCQREQAIDG